MDPISIIGLAASVAGVINLVSGTLSTVTALKLQWEDADLVVLTVETQLIAFKAALTRIEAWINNAMDTQFYQLVMDLEKTIACCQLLAAKIGSDLANLERSSGNVLELTSKLKLLFKGAGIREIQRMMESQTSALTLLLTVCNW